MHCFPIYFSCGYYISSWQWTLLCKWWWQNNKYAIEKNLYRAWHMLPISSSWSSSTLFLGTIVQQCLLFVSLIKHGLWTPTITTRIDWSFIEREYNKSAKSLPHYSCLITFNFIIKRDFPSLPVKNKELAQPGMQQWRLNKQISPLQRSTVQCKLLHGTENWGQSPQPPLLLEVQSRTPRQALRKGQFCCWCWNGISLVHDMTEGAGTSVNHVHHLHQNSCN